MSLGYVLLTLVIYVLAVMRLTRLINSDTILNPMRLAFASKVRDEDRSPAERNRWAVLAEFLGCPWCVGMWLSLAGAVPVILMTGWPWWTVLPIGLAASMIIGMADPLYGEEIEIVERPADPS